MEHLNSVLLEGIVADEPERSDDAVYFTLRSSRNDDTTSVCVISRGELGDKVMENLHRRKLVRVVGRLESRAYWHLMISAQFVEFRTVGKKKSIQE